MTTFRNPHEEGAKERFAHLHYRAACIRLEVLSQTLNSIEARGGIDQAPSDLLGEALSAAVDVAENLRWSYERKMDSAHGRLDALVDSDPPQQTPAQRAKSPDDGANHHLPHDISAPT